MSLCFILTLMILAEILETSSAQPFGGRPLWEIGEIKFQRPLNNKILDRLRDRRSLASGRWGLRPGKRSGSSDTAAANGYYSYNSFPSSSLGMEDDGGPEVILVREVRPPTPRDDSSFVI